MQPDGQQGALFLALTFLLTIIVVLMGSDAVTAFVLIGLLFGFAYSLMATSGRGRRCDGKTPPAEEVFYLPAAAPPYANAMTRPLDLECQPSYSGAIDIDEHDTEPGYGHRDNTEGDNAHAPEGNPFNLNRIAAPQAASACVDDEANDDELDGDERMNYQARARNDPTRAVAGSMNRCRDLDAYLREEVDEEGDRAWWGRHEY